MAIPLAMNLRKADFWNDLAGRELQVELSFGRR
jgi:hypothetical protein